MSYVKGSSLLSLRNLKNKNLNLFKKKRRKNLLKKRTICKLNHPNNPFLRKLRPIPSKFSSRKSKSISHLVLKRKNKDLDFNRPLIDRKL